MVSIKIDGFDKVTNALNRALAELYIKNVNDQIGQFTEEIYKYDPNAVIKILPNGEGELIADLPTDLWDRIKAAQK